MNFFNISNLISLLMLGITGLIAYFNYIAAKEARKAAKQTYLGIKSQIISHLYEIYSSDEMYLNIKKLVDFYNKNNKKIDKYNPSKNKEIELARRYYKFYFLEIYKLFNSKIIDYYDVKSYIHSNNVAILIMIIEPLEKKINPNSPDKDIFEFYKRVCPDYIEAKIGY